MTRIPSLISKDFCCALIPCWCLPCTPFTTSLKEPSYATTCVLMPFNILFLSFFRQGAHYHAYTLISHCVRTICQNTGNEVGQAIGSKHHMCRTCPTQNVWWVRVCRVVCSHPLVCNSGHGASPVGGKGESDVSTEYVGQFNTYTHTALKENVSHIVSS